MYRWVLFACVIAVLTFARKAPETPVLDHHHVAAPVGSALAWKGQADANRLSPPDPPAWGFADMPGLLRTDVPYVVGITGDQDASPKPAHDRRLPPGKATELIEAMAPGTWLALPVDEAFAEETLKTEKAFNDDFVAAGFAGINPTNRHDSVIAQWSGGAYDPDRHRHYHWGSGHGAYDNGIYAFDLNDLEWHRVQPPIPDLTCDKAPLATHSYDTVEYRDDRLYVINHPTSGDPCRDALPDGEDRENYGVWAYDFSAGEWERLVVDYRFAAGYRRESLRGGADIVDDWYIILGNKRYFSYNLVTGAVKGGKPDGGWLMSGSAAYGAGFFVRHAARGDRPGALRIYRVDNGDLIRAKDQTFSGATLGQHAGIDYDPKTGKFWLWNDGCEVHAVDPDDWSVEKYSNDGCPVVEGASVGPYGNWQYLPEYGVFLGINNTQGPNGAYVWKPR